MIERLLKSMLIGAMVLAAVGGTIFGGVWFWINCTLAAKIIAGSFVCYLVGAAILSLKEELDVPID